MIELFLDSVGGGAWPFLVRGVICLVNSDNERDSSLLTMYVGWFWLVECGGAVLLCLPLHLTETLLHMTS